MFFLFYNVVSNVMRIIVNIYVLVYIVNRYASIMELLLSYVDFGYQSAYHHFVVYRLQR